MKFHAALFDFDGTLTPSLPLWIGAYRIALKSFDIDATDDDILRRCAYRDSADVAADFGSFTAEQFETQLERGLQQTFLQAELFPLARPIVAHCRDHGLRTALITSSPRSLVIGVLTRLHILDAFDFVTCGGDHANYKPHPEPVIAALTALQCAPAHAMMIGDSHVDILAGKSAGTRTALFLSDHHLPYHNADHLRACGPDHIFADHAELPALLQLPALP